MNSPHSFDTFLGNLKGWQLAEVDQCHFQNSQFCDQSNPLLKKLDTLQLQLLAEF